MTKENISFIMPAYNCEKTIAEAVESIFNGNFYPGDELIIVNDGSIDGTKSEIEKLRQKYPIIKVIDNKQNQGCPTTRNIGIRVALNPLIFNLDADDILARGSVPKLKKYMFENEAEAVAFSESRFFTKSKYNPSHKWVIKPGILTLADYLAGPIVPGGNFLYTKASWERIGGYWEYGKGLHEFWGFALKQLANKTKMVVRPKSYYFHRYGTQNSLFIREFQKKEASSLMATKMIMNFIDLINEDDANYLRSEEGSKTWFENLNKRPIRLKSGEMGVTGKIKFCGPLAILRKIKSLIMSIHFFKTTK